MGSVSRCCLRSPACVPVPVSSSGLRSLGANAVYFDLASQRIGERESVKDYAKNLDRWCDCIVARVHAHRVLEDLADHASIPVVNALSDREHPCQAIADLLTLQETLGSLRGKRLVFVGDGNNVCASLMLGAAASGMVFTAITPDGREPDAAIVHQAEAIARETGGRVRLSDDPADARHHHAVYTDTWQSMGKADEDADSVRSRFAPYAINDALMSLAGDGIEGGSWFMHCLPATRGAEVAESVIDGPRSLVYEQAENRMHAQNALLRRLLGR